jgi:hypothetical protein
MDFATNSTVFPGNSKLPFIEVQRGQSVTLFPVVEASQLIALQSLLTLFEHVQLRAALKCLVQDHGDALASLREGDCRGAFFSSERFLSQKTMWPVTKMFDDAANPSNYVPHSPPNRPRSCSAGGILPWPCAAVATRANAPRAVSGTALDR